MQKTGRFSCAYVETVFAYGPPMEAFDRIAAAFTELTFTITYSEVGFGETGAIVWTDGCRIVDVRVSLC